MKESTKIQPPPDRRCLYCETLQYRNDENFRIHADNVDFKRTKQPEAHARLHLDFGSIERSLIKIALNTVCIRDPDAARHIAFAQARRYATHGPIDGTCEFVHHEWMTEAPGATALVAREGMHTLILHHLVDAAGPAAILLALLVHRGHGRLLPEWWICCDHVVVLGWLASQAVLATRDGRLTLVVRGAIEFDRGALRGPQDAIERRFPKSFRRWRPPAVWF